MSYALTCLAGTFKEKKNLVCPVNAFIQEFVDNQLKGVRPGASALIHFKYYRYIFYFYLEVLKNTLNIIL